MNDAGAGWKPMRSCLALALLVSGVACAGQARTVLPQDVQAFVGKRDMCDHFRGEVPYDKARRQFLIRKMDELCTGTDARLAALKKKYASDETVQSTLAKYEPQIEYTEQSDP